MSKQHPTHDDLYPDSVGKHRDLVPQGTKHYLRSGLVFDDYVQTVILDLIAAGEHGYVACQLAGVRRETLSQWLIKGRKSEDPTDAYFKFYLKYKSARLKGLAIIKERQRMRREDPQGFGDTKSNSTITLPMMLFTEENKQSVFQYLREGTFDVVAAEASGVPAAVYLWWINEGKREMQRGIIDGEFYTFMIECMKIAAQARATAETRVWEDMPLAYLLHGPARNKPEMPGWSKTTEISGPSGGPIQIETNWKVSTAAPVQVEGSIEPTQITEAHTE